MFLRDVWSYSPDSPPPPRSASLRLGHCTQYCSLGTVCRALTTHNSQLTLSQLSRARAFCFTAASASLLYLLLCIVYGGLRDASRGRIRSGSFGRIFLKAAEAAQWRLRDAERRRRCLHGAQQCKEPVRTFFLGVFNLWVLSTY